MSKPKRIVFIDRDGTINKDPGYLGDASRLQLLEGAQEGLKQLKALGFLIVVVSNQSGIGRGFITKKQVTEVNNKLSQLLGPAATYDSLLYCPHAPKDECSCRKPKTGLVDFDFDKINSYMIGDKLSDINFGLNLGLEPSHCILVRTGEGKNQTTDAIKELTSFPSLYEASKYIGSSA